VHVDDFPSLFVNPDGGIAGFFASSVGSVNEEFDHVVEGVFLVVPKDTTELVFHNRIRRRQKCLSISTKATGLQLLSVRLYILWGP
jgi:hypothetical protein